MINSYKINRMKITLSALIIGIFYSSFSQSNEIGIIGFVLGNAFNQDGKKLNVGDPIFLEIP